MVDINPIGVMRLLLARLFIALKGPLCLPLRDKKCPITSESKKKRDKQNNTGP